MRKAQIIHSLNYLLGDSETHSLENRVFNSVVILITLTGGIATVYNIFLHNHIIITACSATSVILTSCIYGYSRKTGKYRQFVVPGVCFFFVIMIVGWLANDGTKGADAYFLFLLMTSGILLLQKPFPVFFVAIFMTLIGLLAVEFYCPAIFIGYETGIQRFLDMGISLILCLVFNGMIIHFVFREYLRERRLKDALLAQTIRDKDELERAQNEIRVLRGYLPICASCKNIRDESGNWNQIEKYLSEHSEARLSHGICPDCVARLYPYIRN